LKPLAEAGSKTRRRRFSDMSALKTHKSESLFELWIVEPKTIWILSPGDRQKIGEKLKRDESAD
jgi:hypothetical protein